MAKRHSPQELKAFGSEVLRLRDMAGVSQTELARRVSVTRSYISQVEAGTTKCRRDFAVRLDEALGTEDALSNAWDDLLRTASYPRYFADFSVAEIKAAILRNYEHRLVWGLLQTEDYARALLPNDDAVQGRIRRQNALLFREPPPRVWVVMEETVLLRQVNGPEVMTNQMQRLLEVSELEHVTLQIAPLAYYRNARAAFTIATQPNRSELVYLENAVRGETSSTPEDLMEVSDVFARLQAEALTPRESRERIQEAMEKWAS